jgi:Arc/MetJ-type ribon-helix-helix transcriptional regulator
MTTIQLKLPDSLSEFLEAQVAAGVFESRESAIEVAVRMLQATDERRKKQLSNLDLALEEAERALEAGEYDEVAWDELEDYLAARGRERTA